MKNNKFFILGMLVMVLTFSFVVAGCPMDSDEAPPESELDKLLSKYMGPNPQTWGDEDDAEEVTVCFLDTARFAAFKAELDEYYQSDNWNDEDQDWIEGKPFARWAERPDGSFELDLCKDDNSRDGYQYKKVPQAGAAWDEQWDEGKITLTYLGLEAPFGFDSRREGGGAGEYEGYYEFYYHSPQDDGHHTCYVYYPTTGRSDDDVQYSEWLD